MRDEVDMMKYDDAAQSSELKLRSMKWPVMKEHFVTKVYFTDSN